MCEIYRMSCSSARCRSFDRMPLTPLVRTHTPLIGGVCSTNGLKYPRQKAAVGVGLYIHSKNFFYSNFGAKVQLFPGILNSIDHKMRPMRNLEHKVPFLQGAEKRLLRSCKPVKTLRLININSASLSKDAAKLLQIMTS